MTRPTAVAQTGVVLCNLGTPAAASTPAVRSWLTEMLTDRRIVDLPPLLWKPILYGAILRRRPAPVAEKYAAIWDSARDASPLLSLTQCLSDEVRRRLVPMVPSVRVATAMRYGAPSVATVLDDLAEQGCKRVLLVPLYPQYSFSTTESIADAVRLWQKQTPTKTESQAIQFSYLSSWYQDEDYIRAIANSVQQCFLRHKTEPELLLVSFHGLPEKSVRQGDPYRSQCEITFRLVAEQLKQLGFKGAVKLSFQSRFGPLPWLQPYTAAEAVAAAEAGVKSLAVVTPGFATDCLETLEEIGVELRELFCQAGGKDFLSVPCLNSSAAQAELLAQLVATDLHKDYLHKDGAQG